MSDAVLGIQKLRDDLIANPDLIDEILVDKFDLMAVLSGVEGLGYSASEADIEGYLQVEYPEGRGMADIKYYVEDAEKGEFRELTAAEAEAAGGGFTVALAIVAVAAVAYAVVLAIGAAVVFISTFAVGVSPIQKKAP